MLINKSRLLKYLNMMLILFAVWASAFGSARFLRGLPVIRDLYITIEEQNIDASALFYTEEIKTARAEKTLQKRLK